MSTNIVIYTLITQLFIPLLHLFSLYYSYLQPTADAKFAIGSYKIPENQRKKEKKHCCKKNLTGEANGQ